MKKLLLVLVAFFFMVGMAQAASNVTLQWVANSEPDLAGYKIYQSQTSGIYTSVEGTVPVGTETITLEGIPDGTYFWVVTAYDTEGLESGYSNEVTKRLDTTPPDNPQGLLIGAIEKIIAGLEDVRAYLIAKAEEE